MNRLNKHLLIVYIIISGTAFSQDMINHNITKAPLNSRFEIIQSNLGVRYTFKIDKYNGEVFQLRKTSSDNLVWSTLGLKPAMDIIQSHTIRILEENETSDSKKDILFDKNLLGKHRILPNKVNFQIFISGLGIRHTYLLHIHTGMTWLLVKNPENDELNWKLINNSEVK